MARYRDRVLTVTILFVGVLACLSYRATAYEAPNRLRLLELLRNGDFGALEQALTNTQDAYESGQVSDLAVSYSFRTFDGPDPRLAERLDQWVLREPGSYAARLARARLHITLGWIKRGSKFARNTSDKRFADMRLHFDRAEQDLGAALAANPRLSAAYAWLINIYMVESRREDLNLTMRAGLAASPDSFLIRDQYLHSLVPKWNSKHHRNAAYLQILRFVDRVRRDSQTYPQLRPLLGFPAYVLHQIQKGEPPFEERLEQIDTALGYGDYYQYRISKAYIYSKHEEYAKALEEFERANELLPLDEDLLSARAKIYRKLGKLEKAFADWDLALRLAPYDPAILMEKVYALIELGRFEEALGALDKALVYGVNSARIWNTKGDILLYQLKDYEQAAPFLKRATDLSPNNSTYWYNYAYALYHLRDCALREALRNYVRICEGGQACSAEHLAAAKHAIPMSYLHLTCN